MIPEAQEQALISLQELNRDGNHCSGRRESDTERAEYTEYIETDFFFGEGGIV